MEDLRESPAYQLWLASNAWQRVVRRALEPLGITHVQFVVLASLDRLVRGGRAVTQVDVCRFGALDENMTSQVVKILCEKGQIEKKRHPEDGRASSLSLTASGRALVEAARHIIIPAKDEFFGVLGPDAERLAQLLDRLNTLTIDSF